MRIGTGALCGPFGGGNGSSVFFTTTRIDCVGFGGAAVEWPRNGSHARTPAAARTPSAARTISRRRTGGG